MKVSSKTDYAIRTVVDLARQSTASPVSAADIAKRQHIPKKFLEQILIVLKTGGIVQSIRGARGGYHLSASPSDITLEDIVRITEPDLLPNSVQHDPSSPLNDIWIGISKCIQQKLHDTSIQDICRREDELKKAQPQSYSI